MKIKNILKKYEPYLIRVGLYEPYLSMVGLLFMLSWAGNFSVSHMRDLNFDVLVMLSPYGLIRSQVFSEPVWLLPYYHQTTEGSVLPDAVVTIALLWTRFFFFLRKWTL